MQSMNLTKLSAAIILALSTAACSSGGSHSTTSTSPVITEQTAAEKAAAVAPQAVSTGAPAGVIAGAKDAKNEASQKKAEEAPAAPTENLKLAELGQQLLQAIKAAQADELNKQAEKPQASGVPGQDTKPASMGAHTDKVNKNEQGHPEKLTQGYEQHPGKDGPLHGKPQNEAHASGTKAAEQVSQEELDKQASFELGRQFCRNFLQTKVASQQEVYKEAGRRDFETLIAQAAAELDQQKQAQQQPVQTKQASAVVDESYAEKQAEEAGAQAFYAMMKQAQEEYQAEQVKLAFEQRVQAIAMEKAAAEKRAAELEAQLKAKEAEMQKKAEEEKRAQEFHAWGNYVVDQVLAKLQSEAAR